MQSEFFLFGGGFGFCVLTGGGILTGGGVVVITGLVSDGETVGFGVSPFSTFSDGETDGVEVGVWVVEIVEVGVGVTFSVVPLLA